MAQQQLNEYEISSSRRREDYEILIKQKYDSGYLAYCPQLNRLIKGNSFDTVYNEIDMIIFKHINSH